LRKGGGGKKREGARKGEENSIEGKVGHRERLYRKEEEIRLESPLVPSESWPSEGEGGG